MEQADVVKALKPRLRQLLDLLPQCDWVVSRAAVQVGYSKDYAQKRLLQDDTFCRAMEAKRQEFMRETGWEKLPRLSWEFDQRPGNVDPRLCDGLLAVNGIT